MTCKDCKMFDYCGKKDGTTRFYNEDCGCGNIEELCGDFKKKPLMKDFEKYPYMNFMDIFKFLGFDYKFKTKSEFPFNKNPEDIIFNWGQVLIPKYGIFETVQNKISNINESPLKEIHMMYQIPFLWKKSCGIINQNISLTFRYDKEYKYGDVKKSIYEVCFFILENAKKTNDFYIIEDTCIFDFFSYFICNNQWGIGATKTTHGCSETYISSNKAEADLKGECEL